MGYSIDYVDAFEDDLQALQAGSQSIELLWLELIDLIYDVETVADELTRDRGYRAKQPCFDTVPVGELLRRGFNIGRVKLYRPDGIVLPQRLLYALDHRSANGKIWLLGLMPRKVNYEPQDPFIARVLGDYERLGIPGVPRG